LAVKEGDNVFGITAIYIARNVAAGHFQIGYFTMVLAMLINLFSTVKGFSYFMLNQNWYVKVLDAYYEIMDNVEYSPAILPNSENKINVNNLCYKYPQSNDYALRNISNSFKIGEKIAIVGKNGSGKTTFISILLDLKNFEGEYYRCIDG
jgi:ATP-binding cassette subfamily B protein